MLQTARNFVTLYILVTPPQQNKNKIKDRNKILFSLFFAIFYLSCRSKNAGDNDSGCTGLTSLGGTTASRDNPILLIPRKFLTFISQ
jgi:hypothetical protein